jgi:hypothetical protein
MSRLKVSAEVWYQEKIADIKGVRISVGKEGMTTADEETLKAHTSYIAKLNAERPVEFRDGVIYLKP